MLLTTGIAAWVIGWTYKKMTQKALHETLSQEQPKNELSTLPKNDTNDADTIVSEGKEYVVKEEKRVVASWYGGKFHWRKTASGEVFNKNELTAAHKTLPFGTKVLLVNEEAQDSVIVEVNDRWPYVKGRELDVSEGAAKKLGNLRAAGHKKLLMQILSPVKDTKRQFPTT